jgi:hypothetical protein
VNRRNQRIQHVIGAAVVLIVIVLGFLLVVMARHGLEERQLRM